MLESLNWPTSVFVTLTYDDDHVPITFDVKGDQKLRLSLYKRDYQLFFKRLRKAGKVFKYYLCGEYGSKTFRPHYHFIGFGLSEDDLDLIQETWDKGHVEIGTVTMKSCNYVAGYIQKKLYGEVADNFYGYREWPFSAMSKGLGRDYFITHKEELLENNFIRFHKRKVMLPRYFWKIVEKEGWLTHDEVLWLREEIKQQAIKREKLKAARRGLDFESEAWQNFIESSRRALQHNLEIIYSRKERDYD